MLVAHTRFALRATYRGGAIAASGQIASENHPQDGIAG